MNYVRGWVLAGLAVVASAAQASFDLILVADAGQNCIHRYDGDTGTYLGRFGQNFLSGVTATTIDPVTKTLWVGSTSGLFEFNYNTGALLTVSSAFTQFTDLESTPTGGIVRTLGSSSTALSVIQNPRTSSSASSLMAPATTWSTGGVDSTGDGIAIARSSGAVVRFNQLTNIIEASTSYSTLTAARGGDIRDNRLLVISSSGFVDNLNTQTLTLTTGSGTGPNIDNGIDVAFGHNNTAWALGTTAGGTAYLQPHRTSINGSVYSSFGSGFALNQVTTPVSLSVVLAPEPGTLFALGAGALGLLRAKGRRRRPRQ